MKRAKGSGRGMMHMGEANGTASLPLAFPLAGQMATIAEIAEAAARIAAAAASMAVSAKVIHSVATGDEVKAVNPKARKSRRKKSIA